MSHVDEGTLHALLDGELDGDEQERVRSHLEGCVECRARYQEATELASEADSVVAAIELPDQLDPGAAKKRRVPGHFPRGRWLAWAATVVLAVGAGYLGLTNRDRARPTELLDTPGRPPVPTVGPAAEPVEQARRDAVPSAAPAEDDLAQSQAGQAVPSDQAAPVAGRGQTPAPEDRDLAERQAEEDVAVAQLTEGGPAVGEDPTAERLARSLELLDSERAPPLSLDGAPPGDSVTRYHYRQSDQREVVLELMQLPPAAGQDLGAAAAPAAAEPRAANRLDLSKSEAREEALGSELQRGDTVVSVSPTGLSVIMWLDGDTWYRLSGAMPPDSLRMLLERE